MADVHGSPAAEPQMPAGGPAPAPAPYSAGDISPVYTGGDDDAGGRDDVSGTVAGAVAAAEARYREHESDTYSQGSTIGDLMSLAPGYPDAGTVAGLTDPEGRFYDPPRSGNQPGA